MDNINVLGCYYMHIFYPSNLLLKDKSFYSFEVEDKKVRVIVMNHLRSLLLNDFDNRIARIDDGEISNFQPLKTDITISKKAISTIMDDTEEEAAFVIDYEKHLRREYYQKKYTEIIVSFEASKKDSNIEFAQKVLDIFISSYRIVSNDILTLALDKLRYVPIVLKESFHLYTENELKLDEEVRIQTNRAIQFGIKTAMFPFYTTDWVKFETDTQKNQDNLKMFFSEKKQPDSLAEFLLKAREELYIHKNYKYSFIESWTALEISIVDYLRKIKLEKGISKNKIDTYESEIGISYLLNIELPLVQPDNNPLFKDLISKVDAVRRLRNKLIHENRSISEDEAENALEVAIKFVNYLGFKKY